MEKHQLNYSHFLYHRAKPGNENSPVMIIPPAHTRTDF
jgi:hypothetical protein